MTKKNKSKRRFPTWAIVVISLLVFIWLAFLATYGFVQYKLGKINRPSQETALNPDNEYFETGETAESGLETMKLEDVVWDADAEVYTQKGVTNIMLIGQDKQPGEARARSDSMIIVSINKNMNTITLTSLMRDLYIQIPGYSDNRINAAYQFGGMELLDETVAKNFGVKIDGNIEVDFDGFQAVIEKIGGIDIDLNSAEAEHLNAQKTVWNLSEGINRLNGEQALAYARIRKVGNSDYERTDRQRRVLMAVFDEMKSISVTQMLSLADDLFPLMTTDMSNSDLIGLGMDVLKMGVDELETYRIPVDGSYDAVRIYVKETAMDVLIPDLEASRKYLKTYIYGEE